MANFAIDGRFILRQQRVMPTFVTTVCKLLPKSMPEHIFYILINTVLSTSKSWTTSELKV